MVINSAYTHNRADTFSRVSICDVLNEKLPKARCLMVLRKEEYSTNYYYTFY